MNKLARFASICSIILLATDMAAEAGEFVTPEVPAEGRSVPFCSSALGCYLSGVRIPDYGVSAGAPHEASSPDPNQPPASAQPSVSQASDEKRAGAHLQKPSRPKPKAKQPPSLIVGVDASEVALVQGLLRTTVPRPVKVVPTSGTRQGADVDLTLATTLDQAPDGQTATLFTRHMHVLAGAPIHSIEDLRDQIVSFGPNNSPSQLTAREAFKALNVSVKETPLDTDNAIDGLTTGDIAAVIIFEPDTTPRLKGLSTPGLHLLSWPEGVRMPNGLDVLAIDPAPYSNLAKQGERLREVSVGSILALNPNSPHKAAAGVFLTKVAQLTKRRGDGFKPVVARGDCDSNCADQR